MFDGGAAARVRLVEGNAHVRLGGEIVEIVGDNPVHKADLASTVAELAVVQEKPRAGSMPVFVQVVISCRVGGRGPASDAMCLLPLRQLKVGEVRQSCPVMPVVMAR